MPYETLQERGMFGVRESINFATLMGDAGDGYTPSALIGSSCGTREWSLTWGVLPQNTSQTISYKGNSLSRADYLWEFYCQRMREGNSSFIIESPVNSQYYLACFADTRLSYELIATQLFTTGVQIKQRRESGVTVFEPSRAGTLWAQYDASQETDFSDDEDVPTISDFSGNARHLGLTGAVAAKYKTNVTNSLPVFRWAAASDTYYQWLWELGQDKLSICNAFVVCKYTGASFATYAGLITRTVTDALLVGDNGTTKFVNLAFGGTFDYRKNNTAYTQATQQAPMNAFGIVNVNIDAGIYQDKVDLQVGLDRGFASRYWLGDIAEILLFSSPLRQSAVEEVNEHLKVKYAVT